MTTITGIQSTQGESNETNKPESGELFKTERIGETPFEKISRNGKSFVVLGQYRVTNETEDKETDKLAKSIVKTDWGFMMAVVSAIVDTELKIREDERSRKQAEI